MLRLDRKPHQSLVIVHNNEVLRIHFHSLSRSRARLAVEGPESFKVLRAELAQTDQPSAEGSSEQPTP